MEKNSLESSVSFLRTAVGVPQSLNRLFIITTLVYVYFVGGYINNSMTNSIAVLTTALVEDQSIVVDPYLFDKRDVATHAGHYYSGMPPGTSVLLVPVYCFVKGVLFFIPTSFKNKMDSLIHESLNKKYSNIHASQQRFSILLLLIFAVFFVSIPLAIGMGYSFFKTLLWANFCDKSFATILCAFLLLGTNVSDFSATFYHNTVAACLGWFVFVKMLIHYKRPYSKGSLLFYGFLLGLMPCVDYPALAYAGILFLAMCFSFKKEWLLKYSAFLMLGFLISIAFLLFYHYCAFGSPWVSPYQVRAIERVDYFFQGVNESRIWSFLPTSKKIIRVFVDSKISLLIYSPFLVLGIFLSLFYFYSECKKKTTALISLSTLLWGTSFFMLLANFCYFSAIPLRINPSWGSYGARYTVYAAPYSLLVCAPFLYAVYRKINKQLFFSLLCLLSIPAWLYLFYGSPNRSFEGYGDLFFKIGPANYTLTKAIEAGLIQGSLYSYIGVLFLLFGSYLIWKK